jgi:signal peptidase I
MSEPGPPCSLIDATPPRALSVEAGLMPVAPAFRLRAMARRAAAGLAPISRWLLRGLGALALLSAARSTLADQYHVPTSSMWPTIAPGDRILVDKSAYGLRVPFAERPLVHRDGPRAGDVVLFDDPRGGSILLVKRVVALSGQVVMVRQGVLYVDDVPQRLERLVDGTLVEHLGEVTHAAGEREFTSFGPIVVPPAHLFVMGDNRGASLDSRMMGPVPSSLVRGQVLGVTYHSDAAGFDLSRGLRRVE